MQVKEKSGTHIRWWLDHDITYLVQIDRDAFRVLRDGKEDLSRVWTKSDYERIRAQRVVWGQIAVRNPRLRTNLNVVPGQIVGHVIYRLIKDTEVILERLAVSQSYRKMGIGTQLVEKVKTKLYGRRKRLTALIRESDDSLRRFFTVLGFRASLVRDAFEEREKDQQGKERVLNSEDGYMMTYEKP
jgi:ribosomal protein S18 acetylase RimI-like enzyme